MSTQVDDQTQVYEAFKRYPWDTDKVFQQGLDTILKNMSKLELEDQDQPELAQDLELIKAKHFYFTRFQQNFDLLKYLEYEAELLKAKEEEAKAIKDKEQEEAFQRIEDYDYEKDEKYTNGLPNIIKGWLAEQSKGLWDNERMDWEFTRAKAYYYNSQIEKVNLNEYFSWKAKQIQASKPTCPFANLWQNKAKSGPVDESNASTFVVSEKPKGQGAETLTLSSPKSHNLYSAARLDEWLNTLKEADADDKITSTFITATVHDSRNPFEVSERIETNDTKIISSGLAYQETSQLVSGSDLRQSSLDYLSTKYYDAARCIHPKLVVTFSNGEIPLNAVYLTLGLGFMRVITEFSLLNFSLQLSHAPIPPLLLLVMARARTPTLPAGLELYLALSAPEYGKLRGPEILRLGLADVFVPEAKLSDAFETAKKMAVCPAPDTNAAIQLALAIHHTYPGPNRLQVWEKHIASTFGAAESFEDLVSRLKEHDSNWSKNILAHWNTLPPTLLQVIFKAVTVASKNPLELLALEQKLNSKWRQTEDYKEWLRSKDNWSQDESLEFYFEEELEVSKEEPVVYEAPQETQDDAPAVCPVTGQTSAAAVCPVTGQSSAPAVCPVTGQSGMDSNVCPVTGQRSEEPSACPVSGQKADVAAVCPVTGQKSESNGCPVSGQH